MIKKICYITTMTEIPANCFECKVFGCELPLRKNRSGVTDICKLAYRTKRHKDCPLVEIKEADISNAVILHYAHLAVVSRLSQLYEESQGTPTKEQQAEIDELKRELNAIREIC